MSSKAKEKLSVPKAVSDLIDKSLALASTKGLDKLEPRAKHDGQYVYTHMNIEYPPFSKLITAKEGEEEEPLGDVPILILHGDDAVIADAKVQPSVAAAAETEPTKTTPAETISDSELQLYWREFFSRLSSHCKRAPNVESILLVPHSSEYLKKVPLQPTVCGRRSYFGLKGLLSCLTDLQELVFNGFPSEPVPFYFESIRALFWPLEHMRLSNPALAEHLNAAAQVSKSPTGGRTGGKGSPFRRTGSNSSTSSIPRQGSVEIMEPQELITRLKFIHGFPLSSLQGISEAFPNLRVLHCESNPYLKSIASIEGLRSIEELHVPNCKSLRELPSTWPATLKILNVNGCTELASLRTVDSTAIDVPLHSSAEFSDASISSAQHAQNMGVEELVSDRRRMHDEILKRRLDEKPTTHLYIPPDDGNDDDSELQDDYESEAPTVLPAQLQTLRCSHIPVSIDFLQSLPKKLEHIECKVSNFEQRLQLVATVPNTLQTINDIEIPNDVRDEALRVLCASAKVFFQASEDARHSLLEAMNAS